MKSSNIWHVLLVTHMKIRCISDAANIGNPGWANLLFVKHLFSEKDEHCMHWLLWLRGSVFRVDPVTVLLPAT